jgi:hypothetical protein
MFGRNDINDHSRLVMFGRNDINDHSRLVVFGRNNKSDHSSRSRLVNIKTRFNSKTPVINAKRGSILSILCLMLALLEFLVAAPEPFLCINNVAVCP